MSGGAPGFVHRFLPAQDPASPALLLLHGTGGNESDLLPLGRTLLPAAAMLSPRGQVLENGKPRFFRRLAEGVFDLADLTFRAHELADFVEAASRAYAFDPRRLIAVGYSNGANIAASLLLLRPRVLGGAILFRPTVPLVPDALPDLSGTPVLVSGGRSDPLVPPEQTERLVALLRTAGAEVTLHWQAGGHGLGPEEVGAAREWLARRLAEVPSSAKTEDAL